MRTGKETCEKALSAVDTIKSKFSTAMNSKRAISRFISSTSTNTISPAFPLGKDPNYIKAWLLQNRRIDQAEDLIKSCGSNPGSNNGPAGSQAN